MNVEDDVESAVRNVIAGAVAQDHDKYETALEDMVGSGEKFAQKALFLGYAICYASLLDVNRGEFPDEERRAELADAFVESEAWAEIDQATALSFFSALAGQTHVGEDLQLGDAVELVFVVGAWLLSAFPPEDRAWTTFLDSILDRLESDSVGG